MDPSKATEPLLKVQGLGCGYPQKTILQDVTFTVQAGEHWAIIGENGEGKSTLLRTLVGLLPPRSGELFLAPKPSEVSLVPQHPKRDLRMPMTVEDFVSLGFPAGAGVSSGKKRELVNTALGRLRLSQRKEDVSILSGGQFQRAVLARAMVHFPCILFLDEPARGLDEKSNSLFMDELRCCPRHDSPAIVMVLHDLRLLKKHFSHILWLVDGKAKAYESHQLDTCEELLDFLGSSR